MKNQSVLKEELKAAEKSGCAAMESVLWRYCSTDPDQLAEIVRELLNCSWPLYILGDQKAGFYFFLLDRLRMFAEEHLQAEPYHRFCVLVDSIQFEYW